MTTPLPRSQDEVLARMVSFDRVSDFFAARASTLVAFLDYEHAKPFLLDGTTADQWGPIPDPVRDARDYLPEAIRAAVEHNDLAVHQNLDRYREWAWLSGDDYFEAALHAPHLFYGAPILRAISRVIAAVDIWAEHITPGLERMSAGLPCSTQCLTCI